MKRRRAVTVALFMVSITLIVGGCLPAAIPESPATPPAAASAAAPSQPAWQQNWDQLLSFSKKEQKVVIYTTMGPAERTAMMETVRAKFGLDLQFATGGGSELIAKINSERRAGLNIQDLLMGGRTTMQMAKDAGFLDALSPALILPEVLDAKAWYDEKVPYLDADKTLLSFLRRPGGLVLVNTDLVADQEIKSFRDLLSPKWKGKIAIGNPTVAGAGSFFFMVVYEFMGPSYLEELRKQEPIITRDARQQIEWIAKAKYPIAVGISSVPVEEFVKAGAPVKSVIPQEGGATNCGNGGLAFFKNAPAPNAAKVFINWLLTREGQTVMSQAAADQSKRTDVSSEWILPGKRIQPGLKYLDFESDEMTRVTPERFEQAKKIFGDLMK